MKSIQILVIIRANGKYINYTKISNFEMNQIFFYARN